jgi:hypothetical protein
MTGEALVGFDTGAGVEDAGVEGATGFEEPLQPIAKNERATATASVRRILQPVFV